MAHTLVYSGNWGKNIEIDLEVKGQNNVRPYVDSNVGNIAINQSSFLHKKEAAAGEPSMSVSKSISHCQKKKYVFYYDTQENCVSPVSSAVTTCWARNRNMDRNGGCNPANRSTQNRFSKSMVVVERTFRLLVTGIVVCHLSLVPFQERSKCIFLIQLTWDRVKCTHSSGAKRSADANESLPLPLGSGNLSTYSFPYVPISGAFVPPYITDDVSYYSIVVRYVNGVQFKHVCDGVPGSSLPSYVACKHFEVAALPYTFYLGAQVNLTINITRLDFVQASEGGSYTIDRPTYFQYNTTHFRPVYANRTPISSLSNPTSSVYIATQPGNYNFTESSDYPSISPGQIANVMYNNSDSTHWYFNGVPYGFPISFCATQTGLIFAVIPYAGRASSVITSPTLLTAGSCFSFPNYGVNTNVTLLDPALFPSTSTSANLTITCQSAGLNSTNLWAAVTLTSNEPDNRPGPFTVSINQGYPTITPVNGQKVISLPCNTPTVMNITVLYAGYQPLAITRSVAVYARAGFYTYTREAGTMSNDNGVCTTSSSSGSIVITSGIYYYPCAVVNGYANSASLNRFSASSFYYFLQPPKATCLYVDTSQLDGYFASYGSAIPNILVNQNKVYLFCQAQTVQVAFYGTSFTFQAARVDRFGQWGQNYTSNGLTIIAYPPSNVSLSTVTTVTSNGTNVYGFYPNNLLSLPLNLTTVGYQSPTVAFGAIKTNNPSAFVQVIVGNGTFVSTLNNGLGTNVGYDDTYYTWPAPQTMPNAVQPNTSSAAQLTLGLLSMALAFFSLSDQQEKDRLESRSNTTLQRCDLFKPPAESTPERCDLFKPPAEPTPERCDLFKPAEPTPERCDLFKPPAEDN
ncbi:hypothetical protein PROFUN_09140 [Planoprotostelium fungivorum]|uniref:Uncharacterized protein n=1 Tax=Planoprotostelium fungivorum TaxID=1890364 RepID=A0A2P6MVP2_9EUKA|nr:hypothetical protein PROFUN_09140 [Planoprotostelium fungivorum]